MLAIFYGGSMSTTVISRGFIAMLAFPIHKDQREDLEH